MAFDEEKQIQQLIELYRQGFQEILRILIQKEAKGQWTQYWKDVLKDVYDILSQLDSNTQQWIEQTIGQVYSQATAQTAAFLMQLGQYQKSNKDFAQIHQRAIDVVAQNMSDNMRDAFQFIGRRVDDVFRQIGLEETGRKYASGTTIRDMKQKVIQRLLDQGQTAFVDKLGRKWRLDTYAEMVARTTTREAASIATINECKEFDVDLVQISTHYPTCELCAQLQGKVFSISGKDKRYPKLTDEYRPPIHPNCRHVLTPYVRELDDNAEETERFSNQPLDKDPRSEAEKQAYKEMRDKVTIATIRKRAREILYSDAVPLEEKIEAARKLKQTYDKTGKRPVGGDAAILKQYEEWLKEDKKPIPEHYIEISGMSRDAKKGLALAFKKALDYGIKNNKECLMFINQKGEKAYDTLYGDESSVVLTPELKNYLIFSPKNNVISIHNHPQSSSFSVYDIDVALKFESIHYSTIIGHDGTRYILNCNIGKKPSNFAELQHKYKKYNMKYYNKFFQEVTSGRMSEQAAWKEHSHLIMQDLANEYGWEYRRVMPNEI